VIGLGLLRIEVMRLRIVEGWCTGMAYLARRARS
jgi:hypothetical protein